MTYGRAAHAFAQAHARFAHDSQARDLCDAIEETLGTRTGPAPSEVRAGPVAPR